MKRSEVTKQSILQAAETEFSEKGLSGARIDDIAAAAGANKRMIYVYYSSKEKLYAAVLREVYARLSTWEQQADFSEKTAVEALNMLVQMYFNFLEKNPTFVRLVMWENLNNAKTVLQENIQMVKQPGLQIAEQIIKKGSANGEFRQEVDIPQVILSLNMFCFAYFSNRSTMSNLMKIPFEEEVELQHRISHISEMLLRYLCEK